LSRGVPAASALQKLREGNARFAANARGTGTLITAARRAKLTAAQEPFAIVLGCSDSRVPVELVFDQGPGDLSREVIAPEALKPYVPEEERQETAALPLAAKPVPLPPSRYLVPMTNGWSLAVLDQAPRTGFFHRYAQAVKDGWSRLRGQAVKRPPLVALTMTAADAQRFHHVFRSQLPVVVAAGG